MSSTIDVMWCWKCGRRGAEGDVVCAWCGTEMLAQPRPDEASILPSPDTGLTSPPAAPVGRPPAAGVLAKASPYRNLLIFVAGIVVCGLVTATAQRLLVSEEAAPTAKTIEASAPLATRQISVEGFPSWLAVGDAVISVDDDVVALRDLESLESKWRHPHECPRDEIAGFDTLTLRGDAKVFLLSCDGKHFALDAQTGVTLWTSDSLCGQSETTPDQVLCTVGDRATVRSMRTREVIAAFDLPPTTTNRNVSLQDGMVFVSYREDEPPPQGPPITLTNGSVSDKMSEDLYPTKAAIDFAGTVRWKLTIPGTLYAHGRGVLVGDHEGRIRELQREDGQILWDVKLGGPIEQLRATSNLVLSDNDGTLSALRRTDGTIAWSRPMPYSGFWVDERHVLLSDNGSGALSRGEYAVLDVGTGTELASGTVSEVINMDLAPGYIVYSAGEQGDGFSLGRIPIRP